MFQIFWFFVFVMVNSIVYLEFFAREETRIREMSKYHRKRYPIEMLISGNCFLVSFFVVFAMLLFFIAHGLVNLKVHPNFFM
ncbi:MAG: hypothetical protein UR79_C0004G0032 [Candidatus Campbellbacteria bacterium GW2011_GWD1_35_49]|nr:MAG: hypothetical protein UR74_C0004G0032 [Candidatus Campbellbacteria bacterium GW2011_GWD2_35_24]KKP76542.1 MAG: hypothetical protein UR76_C0004G0032 [Candidatus Campbellbacteria bacterium GW2011_GWC1_35_31]KKP78581.1 MAG: hypothetical protein UR79_C0004G0032 [Candidatus Campbellbacteria bacterium GW2011_GWD1_35_49]HAP74440.1 hypothetical protein [Candidatus Campbellbacteria bacterium]HAQ01874.1 hypothetical protein [Candidatus Campbellbacteria bacterium]